MTASRLQVAVLFPELLGTYGDGGNVAVLQRRMAWHGIEGDIVPVGLDDPVPARCDLYVLGGGEDLAQTAALAALHRSPGLQTAVRAGVPVLAVCAGLQLLGERITDRSGAETAGLGVLDASTHLAEPRLVGDVVAVPDGRLGLPPLTGFANHAGRTTLGPDAGPLAQVVSGPGNGTPGGTPGGLPGGTARTGGRDGEGAVQGSILASYLHGPVLARNPALADLLLARATGRVLPLLELDEERDLRRERLVAAGLGALADDATAVADGGPRP